MSMKPSFYDQSLTHWKSWVSSWGMPSFRAQQLGNWIFQRKIYDLNLMKNLPESLKNHIRNEFCLNFPQKVHEVKSSDDTTKLLLKTPEKNGVYEIVIMRYKDRTSLCLSSQIGCRMACGFCQTGKLGFFRHLSSGEMIASYLLAEELVRPEGRRISHVVFMGMGEPLDNFDATKKTVEILISDFGLSHRKVTISTSGLADKILQLAEIAETHGTKASLAISLHGARDSLRTGLMPINRKFPLATLKNALLTYQKKTELKITIEYILIKGVNTSLEDAKDLVRYLHGLRAKVNLIPFNSHPGMDYSPPEEKEILQFQRYLADRSFPAPVRYSRGLSVSAACGQLAAKTEMNFQSSPRRTSLMEF